MRCRLVAVIQFCALLVASPITGQDRLFVSLDPSGLVLDLNQAVVAIGITRSITLGFDDTSAPQRCRRSAPVRTTWASAENDGGQ